MNRLLYPFFSGKNSKLAYFVREALASCVPAAVYRHRLPALLDSIDRRPDRDDILARAEYCCRLGQSGAALPPPAPANRGMPERDPERFRIRDQKRPRHGQAYYFDSRALLRYFPPDLEVALLAGDVTWVPDAPALVKSRPIAADGSNANSVLLPLNRIRHFLFVRDRLRFADKADRAVFRGKVCSKEKRLRLFDALFGKDGFDLGDTTGRPGVPPEWQTPKLTIRQQLESKFILSIEGNDVASNLKWVLSSTSLAMMPRPEFETWFLEGTLVPNVHYVEIAPDFSDAPDKMRWYAAHPDAAQKILDAAHAHVARFRDPRRERLAALLVLQRYFDATSVSSEKS
jgi:hypothetical protein